MNLPRTAQIKSAGRALALVALAGGVGYVGHDYGKSISLLGQAVAELRGRTDTSQSALSTIWRRQSTDTDRLADAEAIIRALRQDVADLRARLAAIERAQSNITRRAAPRLAGPACHSHPAPAPPTQPASKGPR